jgi:hypothetical protein
MTNPGAAAEMVATTPIEWTWDVLTPIDPTRFYPRFGPLPATVAVRAQTGPWNVAGQTRTLLLSDGGHVIETITDVERCSFFAYELSDFQKVFKRLVDHARAEWTFTAVDGGTLVHWTYEFFPRKRSGWLVSLIVRFWWDPYMRSVLPEIVHEAERLA